MIIFCDIDGTLTDDPENKWGKPNLKRIEYVINKINEGETVLVWSGNGTEYAKEFCKKYGIDPVCAIGKPDIYIDDKPKIRAEGKMVHVWPNEID
jgi:hydroxymethylpyrimidine pyrophosphatase-like HAD family hydrolase